MSFRATVITLYPEMFPGPLGMSLAGKALDEGVWSLEMVALREFGAGRHRAVDDTPAGGGAGMVLRPDVLAAAIDAAAPVDDARPRLLMSPRGKVLDQAHVRELAAGAGAVIVCGRFEGVDERVIEARGLTEISIGDYVLSGGEPAAIVLLDAVVRLLPGVMGNACSGEHESFEQGLLEHPHYTRPQAFEGREIPSVLTSGDHGRIAKWRREQAEKLTRHRRPDLDASAAELPKGERDLIARLEHSLWITSSRYDDAYMNEILADDFFEFGRSGKVWERSAMLLGAGAPSQIVAELENLQVRALSSNCAHVTYVSVVRRDGATERANRSSVWSRGGRHGWRLQFHQGTAIS